MFKLFKLVKLLNRGNPKFPILILIAISFYSCKTITIDDDKIIYNLESAEFIQIPAGVYTAGQRATNEYIKYDYEIMKYPVTNIQYIDYLKAAVLDGTVNITSQSVTGYYQGDKHWPAGIYTFVDFSDPDCRIGFNPPNDFVIKWNYFNSRREGYDLHPVVEVTWFGANAFAEYYGLRLPTTEEWEKAARANTGSRFPWGNEFDSSKLNYRDSGDPYDNGTSPVGYFNGKNGTALGESPYGIYDMSGNIREWSYSWKDQSPGKVLRGGSWRSKLPKTTYGGNKYYSELYTWAESANGYSPNNSSGDIGFRCVKQ